jgi:D-alanine-D-alanine ligase
MGGTSREREVSLRSGSAIAGGLRDAGYIVDEIDVTSEEVILPAAVEAVFLSLHGTFGEDGCVQRILEDRRIPYTGSGPDASRIAFDKIATKEVFEQIGVPTPAYQIWRKGESREMPLPAVVKPPLQGSSIGLHCVFEEKDWDAACLDALQYGERVLVEEFIDGAELTVGIVCGELMPIIEIRAPSGQYDYEAKYESGETEYLVPAPISPRLAEACRRMAGDANRAMGCRGMARIDFRLSGTGELFALEVNTLPGFTQTSLLPKAAQAAGLEFPVLCERIMESATTESSRTGVDS